MSEKVQTISKVKPTSDYTIDELKAEIEKRKLMNELNKLNKPTVGERIGNMRDKMHDKRIQVVESARNGAEKAGKLAKKGLDKVGEFDDKLNSDPKAKKAFNDLKNDLSKIKDKVMDNFDGDWKSIPKVVKAASPELVSAFRHSRVVFAGNGQGPAKLPDNAKTTNVPTVKDQEAAVDKSKDVECER